MTAGRFDGLVAVVTGAGSGIGRATAVRLHEEGAAVACVDVNGEAAAATAAAFGARGLALTCDVSDAAAAAAGIDQVARWRGRIDLLANVAGIGRSVRVEDLTLPEWNATLAVNLTGTFLMCQAALPYLERTSGVIVNVASVAGVKGIAYAAAYAASKGGVVALSKGLAAELADRGVTVHCICPAGVDTAMVEQFRLPAGAARPRRGHPDGGERALTPPEDIAAQIVDLAAGAPPDTPSSVAAE